MKMNNTMKRGTKKYLTLIDKNKTEWVKFDTAYFAFVFGYDLLHDELENSDSPEDDYCFERCLNLASEFLTSDEYADTEHFTQYEALEEWLYNRGNKEYTVAIRDKDTRDGDITALVTVKGKRDVPLVQKAIDETHGVDCYDNEVLREKIEEILGDRLISYQLCCGNEDLWW